MRRRYYVDTSAYLCLLLGETGCEALEEELAGAELVSSCLLALEAFRNLVRLGRVGALASEDLQAAIERLRDDLMAFELMDLTLELCLERSMPAVSTPRSLDLVHLRTALSFHRDDPLLRFVSLDRPQSLAARELGLPV
jgi:hypothetical protein